MVKTEILSRGAELHMLPFQLKTLRGVFEAWPTRSPSAADIAFAYISLSSAIEYVVGLYLRVQANKMAHLVDGDAFKDTCRIMSRFKEDNWSEPLDGKIGQAMFRGLIEEVQGRVDKVTFSGLDRELKWSRGVNMAKQCRLVDDLLWGDIQGVAAVRNIYAHGRPMRIEEEESRHNLEAPSFNMREVVKSLKRIGAISSDGDFYKQAGDFYDVLASTIAITFYWRRVGEFVNSFITDIPYDQPFHSVVEGVSISLLPLNIDGVDSF